VCGLREEEDGTSISPCASPAQKITTALVEEAQDKGIASAIGCYGPQERVD